MGVLHRVTGALEPFSVLERRNMAIYIAGIMIYKFGLEAFNGSIIALATNRYDDESRRDGAVMSGAFETPPASRTFERLGLLTGLNLAFQCVGSILIGPLIKSFPTKNVLACAIVIYAVCSAILLILDQTTGGRFIFQKPTDSELPGKYPHYGRYPTDAIVPIFSLCGIAYGMCELIRRVIPRDIVGGDVTKLRKMDALAHIFYEVAGTSGAFTTALFLIPRLGNNRSFIISPICFVLCAILWYTIRLEDDRRVPVPGEPVMVEGKMVAPPPKLRPRMNPFQYLCKLLSTFGLFFQTIWVGGKIVLLSRQFIWLIPSYSVALYAHRYLENGIVPQIAKRYLDDSALAQVMVGGSNIGELLGALFVFLFTDLIKTPIPWLRLDALLMLVTWWLPSSRLRMSAGDNAWVIAASLIPISTGWAAGDVSMNAFVQASLDDGNQHDGSGDDDVDGNKANNDSAPGAPRISKLGAVMSFLYTLYIAIYGVSSFFLGRYMDTLQSRSGGDPLRLYEGFVNTAGVQFTVVAGLIMVSTFLPKGSVALNPDLIGQEAKERAEGRQARARGRAEAESQGVELEQRGAAKGEV